MLLGSNPSSFRVLIHAFLPNKDNRAPLCTRLPGLGINNRWNLQTWNLGIAARHFCISSRDIRFPPMLSEMLFRLFPTYFRIILHSNSANRCRNFSPRNWVDSISSELSPSFCRRRFSRSWFSRLHPEIWGFIIFCWIFFLPYHKLWSLVHESLRSGLCRPEI